MPTDLRFIVEFKNWDATSPTSGFLNGDPSYAPCAMYLYWALPAFIADSVPFGHGYAYYYLNNPYFLNVTAADIAASRRRPIHRSIQPVSSISALAGRTGINAVTGAANTSTSAELTAQVDRTPSIIYMALSQYPTNLMAQIQHGGAFDGQVINNFADKTTYWLRGLTRQGYSNPPSLNFTPTTAHPRPDYAYTFDFRPIRKDPDYWSSGPLTDRPVNIPL